MYTVHLNSDGFILVQFRQDFFLHVVGEKHRLSGFGWQQNHRLASKNVENALRPHEKQLLSE